MKKGFIKAGVLIVLFLASIFGTAVYINREPTLGTREMEDSRLPVLYMEVAGNKVNPMYGYARDMEQQYMRDSLTPLGTDRTLKVLIQPSESRIKSVAYQVSTADGSEVIESGPLNNLKKNENGMYVEFRLENPILMNQEYTLRFDIQLKSGETYYYYTRLLQRSLVNLDQYLEFANTFYQQCMDKSQAANVSDYLEPDKTETNSTYTKLNIHSSVDRVTWGNMKTELEMEAVPIIKELNDITCSISIEYMISDSEDGKKDYYHVSDFYRMRSNQSDMLLLDFERRTQEIFNGQNMRLTPKGLNLGIVDKNIQYLSNKNSDIVAFVQEGELWSYNRSVNRITRVYGFWDGLDKENACYLKQDIKIVRVEESGDIDFVVYGYMNRDSHEGQVGIAVYHYGAELNQIREDLFIPTTTTFEYLKNDMEQLSYVTKNNQLYVILEGDLYCIDIENKSFQVIREDITKDCYVVSKTQQNIAWMNERLENGSSTITVKNMESGESYEIIAPDGQKIKALGFMNEDLVYGLANEGDIVTDLAGNTTFAMETVRIQRFGGEILKEHKEEDIWVSGINLEEGLLELKRVKWENGAYVPVSSDHIMNNLQINEETVEIRLITTERKATQVGLDFGKDVNSRNILYNTSNLLNQKESPVLDMNLERQDDNIYYVYGKGILDSIWTKAGDAIVRADEVVGIVLNRQQQYVWERGNRDVSHKVNLEEVPMPITSGILDENTLAQTLGDEYMILNMTGCSLESVLYQVSKGNPVVAKVNEGVNVVIIGYDRFNTILYYPATGEQGYYSMDDSVKLFNAAGNVYMGYMEPMGAPSKGEYKK